MINTQTSEPRDRGRRGRQVRRTAAALAAGGALLLVPAAAAYAAGGTHTQSFTDNFHGEQQEVDVNPCNGDPVALDLVGNSVFHITYFPDSDEMWATFTEEDRVTATDTVTGVVYTGHSTFWGNFNLNRQNSNTTNTATIQVKGDDGSSISFHEVSHVTMLPDGNVAVSFDKPSVTCR